MHLVKVGKWGLGQLRGLVVQVLGLMIMLGCIMGGGANATDAPIEISARPYPMGDIRITRETVTSTALRLNISNLNISPGKSNRVQSQVLFVAGMKGQVPSVSIDSAVFTQLKDGRETTSTEGVPDQIKQNVVRVADLGLMRQYWLYSLTLTTMSPAGVDSFWILKDASVTIDIGVPPGSAASDAVSRWSSNYGDDNLSAGLLINPDISPAYYYTDYTDPVDAWSSWSEQASIAAVSGNLFRFSIFEGGFYKLSPDDLAAAIPFAIATTPSQWRVFKDGKEVPLYPDPADPDGAVFLPVAKTPAEGLQKMVYWLDTSGSGVATAGPARIIADAMPQKSDFISSDTKATTAAVFNIKHRELTNYNPKLKSGPGSDKWFWADVSADLSTNLELEFPEYFAPAEGTTVKATFRYGFTNFPATPPDLVLYTTDGQSFKTRLTTQIGFASFELPADIFKRGTNPIALLLDYNAAIEKRPVVIQDIETEWEQELPVPAGKEYEFKLSATSSTGPLELQFSENLPENIPVFGMDPIPVILSANGATAVSSPKKFDSYLVGNTDHSKTVFQVRRVEPFSLNDFQSAQSIIITTQEMASAATGLMKKHEERGLSSTLLIAQDIYNAFSYGRPDPAAIQNALRYLFYKAPGQAPEYITIIGEASDFRGDPRLAPPVVQVDMIPPSTANTPELPQGDERYASVLGADLVADFIVGRIPAVTPQQLKDYLAKQDAYVQGEQGPWSRIAEFIMDDNDEFPDVVDQVVSSSMAPLADIKLLQQWDYQYVPNLRVAGKKRSWTATKAVVDTFNHGLGVLNFFGHGGPNLWSHERLLHLSDLDLITNKARMPLITCASCDNAWISYPMPPVKVSMGEELVLKPDGGAIGLFGPVAGASPYEHSTLVQSLMEGLLRNQIRRIGDAVYYAKNRYYGITRSASIPEQYLLLGDPTVPLRMPLVKPALEVEPREIRAGEQVFTSLSLAGGATTKSTGTLRLVASGDNSELSSVTVGSGENTWQVQVPASYPGGNVMALLETESTDGLQLAGTAFRVLPLLAETDGLPAQRTAMIGDGYEILPQLKQPDPGTATASTYHFQIRSKETTGSVRIAALHDGKLVGEVPSLDITSATELIDFDLPVKGVIGSTSATVQLEVYPLATTSRNDPVTTATFEVPVIGAAALEFVPNSGRAYTGEGEMVAGATVFFEGELKNTGQRPAQNFTLQALQDNPSTGSELQTINDTTSSRIDNLAAGESIKVAFRWESAGAGTYPAMYLVANKNMIVPELEYGDNSLLIPEFTVLPVGNFSAVSLETSPQYAIPGTTITMSAVLSNGNHLTQRPVTVEMGWERTYDKETSSTRFPVTFKDGFATVTRELIAPAEFDHIYVSVNSDFEIEEANMADNTIRTDSMIVSNIPEFETSASLTASLTLGAMYNVIMPFDGQLRVAADFTSASDYLLPTQASVTTGIVTSEDVPSDGAWRVVPWHLSVGTQESPGPISITLPVATLVYDMPGNLHGYLHTFEGSGIPLQTRFDDTSEWTVPTFLGHVESSKRFNFGVVAGRNGKISWQMKKSGVDGFSMGYVKFLVNAIEWDSPPYLLPPGLRSTPLHFAMDAGDSDKWSAVYVEWRAGEANENGGINWSGWNCTERLWNVPVTGKEYLQFRVIGVPVPHEHPYMENFRITR